MRHLINVVDVSHLGQQQIKTEVKRKPSSLSRTTGTTPSERLENLSNTQTIPKTTRVTRRSASKQSGQAYTSDTPKIFHPKRPRKEVPITAASTSFQPPSSPNSPLKTTTAEKKELKTGTTVSDRSFGLPLNPKSKPKTILSPSPAEKPSQNPNVPRIFHPKRLGDEQEKLTESLTRIGTATTKINTKVACVVATGSESIIDEGNQVEKTTNVFQSDHLKRNSNRLELLKLDPAFSDLLPLSGKTYVCSTTRLKAQIKDLPGQYSLTIWPQTLAIWEWKEGSSTARLYEYRIPTSETTIDKRRFKYTGWAWRGNLGQQPPRIQDLPQHISQHCKNMRWYWLKDLWALYYFLT
ncbi:hypothetical protein PGT21_018073 [Puccinia graminis f. sp. tritici]|uniref:Uncharacterized protein n=1 Tax=Puccinia graminis f. sp. tritici TaxID=56615 RepID=A0A5B0LLF3_PUCGR|nr:hypothetical protein PGT21_018073 [Puccinia graminis f. sp. tritici]KAA1068331.1 hypothetical protein PGTUg99_034195 [Puccinia graminis f. sp. tritici]